MAGRRTRHGDGLKSIRGKTSSQTIGWMAWVSGGQLIKMVVSVGSVAILARLLTLEDYGVFAAAMIFIGIVQSGLVQGGFPAAVIQRQDLKPLHIRNAFTGILILHVLVGLAIWFGAGAIADFFAMPPLTDIMRVLCLTIALNPFLAVSLALLKRRKRFRFLTVTNLLSNVVASTAVAIALAWAGYGVWSLVIANITSTVLSATIMFAAAHFNPIPIITAHMRDLLKMSLGMSLVGALNMFAGQASKFVIGRALGADALGLFNRASRLIDFPSMLLGSPQVLFPVMADMNDDRARMARGFLRSIALCSLAAVPLTVLLFHAADGLVTLLLGGQWLAAIGPTAILSLTLVLMLGDRIASVVFMALGTVRQLILRQSIFAVLVIVGSIIGSRWGLEGVCVAVVVAYVLSYALAIHLVNRLLDIGWRRFARANLPGLFLALPVLATLILGETFVWSDVRAIFLFPIEAAATGVVIYGACLIKPAWFLGPDGIWLVQEISRRVPSPLQRLLPRV